jgi:hypothetical protein
VPAPRKVGRIKVSCGAKVALERLVDINWLALP